MTAAKENKQRRKNRHADFTRKPGIPIAVGGATAAAYNGAISNAGSAQSPQKRGFNEDEQP
jgi:hypothetical protein